MAADAPEGEGEAALLAQMGALKEERRACRERGDWEQSSKLSARIGHLSNQAWRLRGVLGKGMLGDEGGA